MTEDKLLRTLAIAVGYTFYTIISLILGMIAVGFLYDEFEPADAGDGAIFAFMLVWVLLWTVTNIYVAQHWITNRATEEQ